MADSPEGAGLKYSVEELSEEIVRVRSSSRSSDLDAYARKWLRLDNEAVLAAIVENRKTPYRALERIVKNRMSNIEILRIAYNHVNMRQELKEKINRSIDKNKEVYYQPFLPSYGRRGG